MDERGPGSESEGEAEGTFLIVNELGLHARAAAKLVTLASRHRAEVEVEREGHVVNAKSVMGVLLLCGAPGTSVTVRARGTDAEAAVRAIGALIADRFGEGR